jgi:hypothetical protein
MYIIDLDDGRWLPVFWRPEKLVACAARRQ